MTAGKAGLGSSEIKGLVELVRALAGGKRVLSNLYLHKDHPSAQRLMESLEGSVVYPPDTNVIRFGSGRETVTISFLYYASFFDDPFPALVRSCHTNIISGQSRRRNEGANPAILHRKELMLWSDHPRIKEYQALTRELIANRLLPAKSFIGRRQHWNRYLAKNGFGVCDGHLTRLGPR